MRGTSPASPLSGRSRATSPLLSSRLPWPRHSPRARGPPSPFPFPLLARTVRERTRERKRRLEHSSTDEEEKEEEKEEEEAALGRGAWEGLAEDVEAMKGALKVSVRVRPYQPSP